MDREAFEAILTSRWTEISPILADLSELPDSEHAAYLNARCVDSQFRGVIEELLQLTEHPLLGVPLLHLVPTEVKDPLVGSHLGPYTVLTLIGRGGMGVVYRGVRDEDQKTVAIKVLNNVFHVDEERTRFQTERQALAGFNHPNIAHLYDYGTTPEGKEYLVLEYIDGQPLHIWCKTQDVDLDTRLEVFNQICNAIGYAHEFPIVHRDITPSNVLITRNGVPKVIDFGIAKVDHFDLGSSLLTTTLTRRPVNLAFASPEQLGDDPTSTRTDIYTLGALLSVLLSGCLPYKYTSFQSLPNAIRENRTCRPSALLTDARCHRVTAPPSDQLTVLRRRLRRGLDQVVLRAVAKSPKRRFPNVETLKQAVLSYPARYRRQRFASILTLLFLLITGGLYLISRSETEQKAKQIEVGKVFTYRPGPEDIDDMYYTTLHVREGAYFVDNGLLKVGGWSDWYVALIKFRIDKSLPQSAARAVLYLMPIDTGKEAVSMTARALSGPWDEKTGWRGSLKGRSLGTLPKPVPGEWYAVDITQLYNDWQSGRRPNYGIGLEPTSNYDQFNYFRSSDYEEDPTLQPRIDIYYTDPFSISLDKSRSQYLEIRNYPLIDLSNDFSLEIWIDPYELGGTVPIISQREGDDSYFDWYLKPEDQGISTCILSNGELALQQSVPVRQDYWSHLAITYERESESLLLYFNGTQWGAAHRLHGRAPAHSFVSMLIGARLMEQGLNAYLHGAVDEVRIWSIVRSPLDIFRSYLFELNGDEDGLRGYWKLNGDGRDQSPSGNHAQLVNGPVFTSEAGVLPPFVREAPGRRVTPGPVVPHIEEDRTDVIQ